MMFNLPATRDPIGAGKSCPEGRRRLLFKEKSDARRAFTLVELLVVMGVISLLIALAVPALSSLNKGGAMNQSLAGLEGLLEQARQYSVAQNTYVWVALYPSTTNFDGNALSVLLLASANGIDSTQWNTTVTVPNSSITQIAKVQTFPQIKLEEAGTFTQTQITSLPAISPPVSSANSLASNTVVFNFTLPGAGGSSAFNRVVEFTPDGQARVAASPIDVVEFGVHPMHGNSVDSNNIAVFRINGLTGETILYRPGL